MQNFILPMRLNIKWSREKFEFVQMEGEIADEKFRIKPSASLKMPCCASAAVRFPSSPS